MNTEEESLPEIPVDLIASAASAARKVGNPVVLFWDGAKYGFAPSAGAAALLFDRAQGRIVGRVDEAANFSAKGAGK